MSPLGPGYIPPRTERARHREESEVPVLTRKREEQIVVGAVAITVVAIGPGRVRLGIEAPADVVVRRAERPADCSPTAPRARPRRALAPTRKGRTT